MISRKKCIEESYRGERKMVNKKDQINPKKAKKKEEVEIANSQSCKYFLF